MWEISSILKYFIITTALHSFARGIFYASHQSDDAVSSYSSHRNNGNGAEQIFGQWSDWSPCSKSCGLGVSQRTRSCNVNLAKSKYGDESLCHHRENTEYKVCTSLECPPSSLDSRAESCSRYNGRLVAGQRAKSWVPTNHGSNPCELRCEALDEKLVYGFGKVEDGTPCKGGICVDGRCLKIGCDDKLGSSAELDMCGSCGGRNRSCVHYKDIFLEQPEVQHGDDRRSNYLEVVIVPVGARNFEIRQRIGENILAMRDRNTAILLHDAESRLKKDQQIAGTVLSYTTDDSNTTEVFRAPGPTTLELHVLVLLRGRNYGIHYQYWLPREGSPDRTFPPARATQSYDSRTRSVEPSRTTPRPQWKPPKTKAAVSLPPVYHRTVDRTPHPPAKDPYYGRSQPSFTSSLSKTTSKPIYGPKRKALLFQTSSSLASHQNDRFSPVTARPITALHASPGVDENDFAARNGLLAPFVPNYRTRKPVFNYYQRFRNNSFRAPVNIYRQKLDPISHQTQRDSSDSNVKTAQKDTELKPSKDLKTEIAYRDTNVHNFDYRLKKPSSRWEYKFNGKTNDTSRGELRPTTAVSISVLPLPEFGNHTKLRREKKITGTLVHHPRGGHHQKGVCGPCHKVKNQARHFCSSDFVIRASVLGYEFLHGETRYELEVLQSFKNTFPLLAREYVWSPDTCRCPKLRIGKEYVIMGHSDNGFRRNESRLLVDRHCFVRTYSLKQDRRLLKLRKNRGRKCSTTKIS